MRDVDLLGRVDGTRSIENVARDMDDVVNPEWIVIKVAVVFFGGEFH